MSVSKKRDVTEPYTAKQRKQVAINSLWPMKGGFSRNSTNDASRIMKHAIRKHAAIAHLFAESMFSRVCRKNATDFLIIKMHRTLDSAVPSAEVNSYSLLSFVPAHRIIADLRFLFQIHF